MRSSSEGEQPEKAEVLAELHRALTAELAALVAMTAAARDEATSPESRPENQYDTRALEASYLAAGQGARMEAMGRLASWVSQQDAGRSCDRALEGALVRVRVGAEARWVLLAPEGGPDVRVGAATVQLISVRSPLGQAVEGLGEGEAAELESPTGLREVEVEAVR